MLYSITNDTSNNNGKINISTMHLLLFKKKMNSTMTGLVLPVGGHGVNGSWSSNHEEPVRGGQEEL